MMVSPVLWSTTLSNLEPSSVSPQPLMLPVASVSRSCVSLVTRARVQLAGARRRWSSRAGTNQATRDVPARNLEEREEEIKEPTPNTTTARPAPGVDARVGSRLLPCLCLSVILVHGTWRWFNVCIRARTSQMSPVRARRKRWVICISPPIGQHGLSYRSTTSTWTSLQHGLRCRRRPAPASIWDLGCCGRGRIGSLLACCGCRHHACSGDWKTPPP